MLHVHSLALACGQRAAEATPMRALRAVLGVLLGLGLALGGFTVRAQAPTVPASNKSATKATKAEPPPVLVGVLSEVTGAGAAYGRDLVRGAEMAVREINAEGGIHGRPIELVVADGGTNPARSAMAMKRLVASEVAMVVGGWGSAQVLANHEVAEQAGMPYIVVGATHPAITSPRNQWTFRVIRSDAVQAEALAGLVGDQLKARRVAVMADASAYGAGSRDAFLMSLHKRGVEPVRVEAYEGELREFGPQLTRIHAARPDVLALFGTLPAAPEVMKQARSLGIEATFVGTGGLANEGILPAAGPAADGTWVTAVFHEDADPQAKAWAARYVAAYAHESKPPPKPAQAAWSYRVMRAIVEPCLKEVGPVRASLRDCITRWKGSLFGLPGELRFDQSRQLVQPSVLTQVKDGRFVLIKN